MYWQIKNYLFEEFIATRFGLNIAGVADRTGRAMPSHGPNHATGRASVGCCVAYVFKLHHRGRAAVEAVTMDGLLRGSHMQRSHTFWNSAPPLPLLSQWTYKSVKLESDLTLSKSLQRILYMEGKAMRGPFDCCRLGAAQSVRRPTFLLCDA